MNLFIRFLATGASGALLSIAITWALTTFVVGIDHYFTAYVVGIAANLLFNFTVYTIAVFKTTHDHLRRLAVFLFYGIVMAFLQGSLVHFITSLIGVSYYLWVIAGVIGVFAVLNFFVFKLSLFKEHAVGERASVKALLVFVLLCAVLIRLAFLFHVVAVDGVSPLIYGDANGYRELATNLAEGKGFSSSRDTGYLVPEVFRAPGLPLLLAPFAGSDGSLLIYFVLLALAGGILLPYVTFAITRRILSGGAALLTAVLVAFEPHLVFFSVLPQTEVPFMIFSYGGLLAAFVAYEKKSWLFASFAGVLLGYASLIRPGFFPVCVGTLVIVFLYQVLRSRVSLRYLAVIAVGMAVVLTPWLMRNHEVTGVYALSGAGWRNVYTDYLASVRAINNHTNFDVEKRALKDNSELAGVPVGQVDNPRYAPELRAYALAQLSQTPLPVLKLETVLLTSYFTQDGYYYQFRRFNLVPDDKSVTHTSATFALLNKGVAGIQDVIAELGRQFFIPIIGRLFTIGVFIAAIVGFFVTRHRMRWVFAAVIGAFALTSTAIGLGVESRLRLPVEPLLFLFVAAACVRFLPMVRFLHED
jgi:hypothetical protein